jgi:hypothetical protein
MIFEVAEELNAIGWHIAPVVLPHNARLQIPAKETTQAIILNHFPVKEHPPVSLWEDIQVSDEFNHVHRFSLSFFSRRFVRIEADGNIPEPTTR